MPTETAKTETQTRYIVVGGSDKAGISAFCRHAQKVLGPGWGLGEAHWLMSPEEITRFPLLFAEKFQKGIASYYVKFRVSVRDPLALMPAALMDRADLALWFELYRPSFQVLKQKYPDDPVMAELMAQWAKIVGV